MGEKILTNAIALKLGKRSSHNHQKKVMRNEYPFTRNFSIFPSGEPFTIISAHIFPCAITMMKHGVGTEKW